MIEYKEIVITGVGYERVTRETHGQVSIYLNGKLHCTDAPAYTRADGYESWWLYGQKHRTDGPAVTKADGTLEFWEKGVHYADFPVKVVKVVKVVKEKVKRMDKAVLTGVGEL